VAVAEAAPPAPEPAPAKPATRKLAAATKRDPAKAQALYERGEAKRTQADYDGAIKLYLAAEQADPALADVHKKLGLCYQLKGDTRRAADRYRKYLATSPADAERVKAILTTLE
jgi:tetratricopeptide (TPR) repeat protein